MLAIFFSSMENERKIRKETFGTVYIQLELNDRVPGNLRTALFFFFLV